MQYEPSLQAFGPTINRLRDLMDHSLSLSCHGVSRLACSARVSPAAVSRVLNGKQNPSYIMVVRLTEAIERELGRRIDPRDIFAEDGRFLTPFVCDLAGCEYGCLPANAYDEFGHLKPTFSTVKVGQWVTSRYPLGYRAEKGGR